MLAAELTLGDPLWLTDFDGRVDAEEERVLEEHTDALHEKEGLLDGETVKEAQAEALGERLARGERLSEELEDGVRELRPEAQNVAEVHADKEELGDKDALGLVELDRLLLTLPEGDKLALGLRVPLPERELESVADELRVAEFAVDEDGEVDGQLETVEDREGESEDVPDLDSTADADPLRQPVGERDGESEPLVEREGERERVVERDPHVESDPLRDGTSDADKALEFVTEELNEVLPLSVRLTLGDMEMVTEAESDKEPQTLTEGLVVDKREDERRGEAEIDGERLPDGDADGEGEARGETLELPDELAAVLALGVETRERDGIVVGDTVPVRDPDKEGVALDTRLLDERDEALVETEVVSDTLKEDDIVADTDALGERVILELRDGEMDAEFVLLGSGDPE